MNKIKLIRGDDEQIEVQIQQQAEDGSLSPFDLTNIARADLHANAQGDIVLRLSTEDGTIEWLNRTSGQMLLNFHHALTENERWQVADYDLQLIDNQGRRKTVLTNRIELLHDITKVGQ